MHERISTYHIDFQSFSIELDVKLQASVQWMRSFNSHGADFVFAVGDVWLRSSNGRYLIVEELQSGNLIELLRTFERAMFEPARLLNVEAAIRLGGWCSWMSGYWVRVADETIARADEAIYEILIPASVAEGREGHIACYKYGEESVFEVATRSVHVVHLWECFDTRVMGLAVREVSQAIGRDLLTELNGSAQG